MTLMGYILTPGFLGVRFRLGGGRGACRALAKRLKKSESRGLSWLRGMTGNIGR